MDSNYFLTVYPWIVLYTKFIGKYSPAESDRVFKAHLGVDPIIAEFIYQKYYSQIFLPTRFNLMIVLHFLKRYPVEDDGAARFKLTRKTYIIIIIIIIDSDSCNYQNTFNFYFANISTHPLY